MMFSASQTNHLASALLSLIEDDPAELYDEAPCGYLAMALDGTIGKCNRRLLEWIGHTQPGLRGRRFHDLISPCARILYETHFAPLLLMQGYVNGSALELYASDGRMIPVVVDARLCRDERGRPALVRMSIFNATERRRHERELLQAKKEAEEASRLLEQRVAERTRELADALAQAQAAASARSAFLAAMSHEIRMPLHAILGLAQAALESGPGRQREYMEKIAASSRQLLCVADDIRNFSRMEAGKLTLNEEP
jgi:PAS domain S-box-containing protein